MDFQRWRSSANRSTNFARRRGPPCAANIAGLLYGQRRPEFNRVSRRMAMPLSARSESVHDRPRDVRRSSMYEVRERFNLSLQAWANLSDRRPPAWAQVHLWISPGLGPLLSDLRPPHDRRKHSKHNLLSDIVGSRRSFGKLAITLYASIHWGAGASRTSCLLL